MVTVKNRCLGFQWQTLCKSVMTEKKVCYDRKKGYLQKVLFHDFQKIGQPAIVRLKVIVILFSTCLNIRLSLLNIAHYSLVNKHPLG